jgi:hypothetical protein
MGRVQRPAPRVIGPLLALLVCCGCGSGGGGNGSSASGMTLGFVVSSFGYAFPQDVSDACPGGFTEGPLEMRINHGSAIPDDCQDPEANADPGFKTYTAAAVLDGFDLDGAQPPPAAATCAHDEFSGPAGERGFDYQLWRAIGCVRGFQRDEIADIVIDGAVKAGSMTILLELVDVDDIVNDDDVGVRLYASLDAPPTGGDGSLVPYGTLSVHPDARYHGSAGRGRLVDGVLVAGPMEIRLRLNIQIVAGDLSFADAWVRVELLPDGTARGRIFGYQPVEEVYEIFGRQAGEAGAEALSYTCSGLYAALRSQADGGFDPSTGTCSALSAIYRFAAEPAFVVR